LEIQSAGADTEQQVKQLLAERGLPYADITPAHLRHFLIVRDESHVAGVVGIEVKGSFALLRSLAVSASREGRGFGSRLTQAIEAYARSLNVQTVCLLTTTADSFFAKRGYQKIDREAVPAGIQETEEFRNICSLTAACRYKHLHQKASVPRRA